MNIRTNIAASPQSQDIFSDQLFANCFIQKIDLGVGLGNRLNSRLAASVFLVDLSALGAFRASCCRSSV